MFGMQRASCHYTRGGKIYLFGIETGGNFLDKTAFVLPGNSDYLDSPSSAR